MNSILQRLLAMSIGAGLGALVLLIIRCTKQPSLQSDPRFMAIFFTIAFLTILAIGALSSSLKD